MIDSRAAIDPAAELAGDVEVGPFSVIGAGVEINSGTRIGSHVVINGPTHIGCDNRIHAFASIGDAPQDKGYRGEPTRLEIGDRNIIREYATINRGTPQGKGVTSVGDDNFLMAYSHIAHDCRIGNNTTFANAASLAGHVTVEDWVILAGFAIVHQFCRIGTHSFCAMGAVISKDVPPYSMVAGHPARPHGINAEGLRRRGLEAEIIQTIRKAHKLLYRSGLTLAAAIEAIEAMDEPHDHVRRLVAFIKESRRSIVR